MTCPADRPDRPGATSGTGPAATPALAGAAARAAPWRESASYG
ncbi:hypothetical protein [Streptomyces sp. O3]